MISNSLFAVPLKIGPGSNTEMPPEFLGAFVDVFVATTDSEAAAHIAVKAITQQGYEFIDVFDKILQLDPKQWNSYILQRWPQLVEKFPTQEDVLQGLVSGFIFFGPFAGFDSNNSAPA